MAEGKNITECSIELGKTWRELSEDDRKPYQALADADKERYEKEMEEWNAKQAAKEVTPASTLSSIRTLILT